MVVVWDSVGDSESSDTKGSMYVYGIGVGDSVLVYAELVLVIRLGGADIFLRVVKSSVDLFQSLSNSP